MSTPPAPPGDTPGFRVQGTFYPDLDIEQWKNDAYTIVRRMMFPATLADFLQYKCDVFQYNAIRAAVCMFMARDGMLSIDEVVGYIGGLKPDEIVPEGYKTVLVEDDAGPPDEETPTESDSSENGVPSSESNPENSALETSGSPPSPTGSEA